MYIKLFTSSILIGLLACEPQAQVSSDPVQTFDNDQFSQHWYDGPAELTGYELTQARYGELHKGEAVLVFVTEPFSRSKHVKLDRHDNSNPDQSSVLKLNFSKKFLTGIYPYSMMLSTFTPVDGGESYAPYKLTMSSQEWCGHTFTQLNRSDPGYTVQGYSYFESEADINKSIKETLTEDELWTRIRLSPDQLPTGNVTLIPGIFYQRLRHTKDMLSTAHISLIDIDLSEFSSVPHRVYELDYPSDKRILKIYFESTYPHTILGWEETTPSGFGNSQELLTTKAKRTGTIRSPYWQQNKNKHRGLRLELGLNPD